MKTTGLSADLPTGIRHTPEHLLLAENRRLQEVNILLEFSRRLTGVDAG
jgi:hypothetical protein